MKKSTRNLRHFSWLLVMLFTIPTPAYAMSARNKKSSQSINNTVEKGQNGNIVPMVNLKYVYADIDGDHVDELITVPGYGYLTQAIYDYQNGKVKTVAVVGQVHSQKILS